METKKVESRADRRRREQINTEAAQTIKTLSDQFMSFFIEAEDPEGNEVVEKMKSIDAKWRVYCKRRNLILSAYRVMSDFMEGAMKEYLTEKEGKLQDSQKDATNAENVVSPLVTN
jgi:hypothetical protein